MWKTLIRPAMIFVPLSLGFLFPEAHQLNWMIRFFLVIMLYTVCLKLRLTEMRIRRSHLKLLALNLGIALIPYLLLHWAGREQLALAAFFIGITPTANAAPVVMGFLHGKVGYVVTGFVITNVGISLALLGLLPLVTGNLSLAFAGRVAQSLLIIMVLPVVLAMLTRAIYPRSTEWPKHMQQFSFALWSCCLFIIAADAGHFFQTNPNVSMSTVWEIALISLLICAVNFAAGSFFGESGFRREGSQTLGQKNTTFTLYLALTFVNPLVAMGPIFYVVWHNTYNAWQMFRHDHRRIHQARLRRVALAEDNPPDPE